MAFKKGQSGNPGGRSNTAKERVNRAFLRDLARTWEEKGAKMLDKLAEEDPATLVRAAVALVPKELDVTQRTVSDARELSDADLDALRTQIRALIAGPRGGDEGDGEKVADPVH